MIKIGHVPVGANDDYLELHATKTIEYRLLI